MLLLGPLVLVFAALCVALVVALARRRPAASASAPPGPPAVVTAADRPAAWAAAGLVTAEQAAAIRAFEATATAATAASVAPAPAGTVPAGARPVVPVAAARAGTPAARGPAPRVPAVAEALGYLGGVLAMVGVVLLVARSWDALGTAGRLATAAGGALVLTLGGLLVRHAATEPALARLRTSLWLAASGTVATLATVVALDVVHTRHGPTVVLAAAASVAVHAAALWRGRTMPVQQATAIAAGLVAVAAGAFETDSRWGTGGVLYAVAGAVLVAGLRHLTPTPAITEALGAAGLGAAGMFVADTGTGAGLLIVVVTAMVLVGLTLAARPVPGLVPASPAERATLGAVATSMLVWSVPATLGWYAQEAGFATGLATAAVGAAVMVAADAGHVRGPHWVEAGGGAVVLGGVALTATQTVGFATSAGLVVAVGLVALGALPGRVLLSVVGSVGLLTNVPWAIGWFFPGEGRAPLLILVSGALIVGVAVLLSRMGGRFRRELRHHGGAS